jgi:hypothetical protein
LQNLVDVRCPDCAHDSQIEYRRLGSATPCSACNAKTVPRVPVGGMYPATQWELRFQDFLMLVRDRDSREHVDPLVRAWFGYRIRETEGDIQIVDAEERALDLLAVHLAIQDDDAKQLSLYQVAMSLWR